MVGKLFQLAHSPWSQKARCALAHHGLEVDAIEYQPFVGEPLLRLRLALAGGQWTGRLSVPVLIAADGVATDSWEIARHSDRVGAGTALIPSGQEALVSEWNGRSDRLLHAGRARFMVRVVDVEVAVRELLPPALARAPAPLIRASMRAFNAKWGIQAADARLHLEAMRVELVALRAALADGRQYLTGALSYADFAMAVALQSVAMRPGTGFGPQSARLGGEPDLAAAFPELLQWRDALYAAHPSMS